MPGRLAGKTAIITGAGQGIGAAVARCFAGEGARVVVAERNVETGVAWTAVFLASDEAPFINAETVVIDGGRSVLYHE